MKITDWMIESIDEISWCCRHFIGFQLRSAIMKNESIIKKNLDNNNKKFKVQYIRYSIQSLLWVVSFFIRVLKIRHEKVRRNKMKIVREIPRKMIEKVCCVSAWILCWLKWKLKIGARILRRLIKNYRICSNQWWTFLLLYGGCLNVVHDKIRQVFNSQFPPLPTHHQTLQSHEPHFFGL